MTNRERSRDELEARYESLQKEIERRGGVSGEFQKDLLPLEAKIEFLEHVIRVDDQINGRPRRG